MKLVYELIKFVTLNDAGEIHLHHLGIHLVNSQTELVHKSNLHRMSLISASSYTLHSPTTVNLPRLIFSKFINFACGFK